MSRAFLKSAQDSEKDSASDRGAVFFESCSGCLWFGAALFRIGDLIGGNRAAVNRKDGQTAVSE